jgi:hypothetical protein
MTLPVIDAELFDLGPATRVTFDGVDLGGLLGNITIKSGQTVVDRFAHQYGKTPISARRAGATIEVDVTLAEITAENLAKAIQELTYSAPNAEAGGMAGQECVYGELRIEFVDATKPMLVIYKSAPSGSSDIVAGDPQAGVKITFKGYIDTARTLGDQLYRWGDPTDTTPPTVTFTWASAVATTTGTLVIKITDTQSLPQTSNLKYGNDDDANIVVFNITTATAPTVIAGAISVVAPNTTGTATVNFNPTTNWGTISAMAVVMPSVRDRSGNRLANIAVDEQDIT